MASCQIAVLQGRAALGVEVNLEPSVLMRAHSAALDTVVMAMAMACSISAFAATDHRPRNQSSSNAVTRSGVSCCVQWPMPGKTWAPRSPGR